MDVSAWLRDLGLERYEPAFRKNAVDTDILPRLTAEDLKDLGVTAVGDRRKLLDAIAALRHEKPLANERSADAEPAAAAIGPEAERRQLTVLFCDLVGSTALSAQLDPEEIGDVIRAYQSTVAGEVGRFEGHVAKYMGDGVLAYFGYPRAHEDDAERAVRAGLALVTAIDRLTPHADLALRVRVGIATGGVVVGELIGSGTAQERAVVGETPNLAARLQALAEPNSVVISPSTRRLVGGLFECADLGPHALKGFAEPLRAWRVTGESAAESRFEALHAATLTPLVGREEELGLLLRRWEAVKEGEGQVVLLSGEPGIGKSRITRALQQRLAGEAYTRLLYFCSPYHQNSALHPVIDQLQRAAEFARDDDDDQKLDKLERLLAQSTEDVAAMMPLFAALLSLPADERYQPLDLDPEQQKAKTLEILTAQLDGLASRRPVLMVFEDVHWVDPTSLDWLHLVVERGRTLAILLIITFRPEFKPPWVGQPHLTSLTLNRLSRKQGATLVERVAAGQAVPAEVLGQIVAKTDGVPLFAEELTKAVLESGLLRDAGDHYALLGPLPPFAIPATLHDSLTARLDRLVPVKEVAQIGAAIGREFSYELLALVSPLRSDKLHEALARLEASELVFRRGTPPRASFTFKHALVQDAAYDSLLRSKRQQIHTNIARVLEQRFPDTAKTQPEVLAHHFMQAGLSEQAITYWQKAGEMAIARSAIREAVAHLTQGLGALKNLSDTVERQQRELDLQVALGVALVGAKGNAASETGRAWARAYELCRALNQPTPLLRVLYGQYSFYGVRAEFDRAREAGEELVRLGAAQADTLAQATGHRGIGMALFYRGELVSSRQNCEQALALDDPARTAAFAYSWDTRVVSSGFLSLALLICGYPDQARARSCEALSRARELSHLGSIVLAYSYRLIHHQLRGDATAALEETETVVSLAAEQGFLFWLAAAMTVRGWALAATGQPESGIAELRQGIHAWQRSGAKFHLPYYRALIADAYGVANYPKADRLRLIDKAILHVEHTRDRWIEAELHRRRGDLLASGLDRDPSEAEACFRRAIAIARRQSARLWELRAATSLGWLLLDQGRRTEARDLVAPIYGWFTEGFDTANLHDARELLDALR